MKPAITERILSEAMANVRSLNLVFNGIMPKFVMWGTYCENVLEKRTPYRQAHLDGLARQKEDGILVTIGPTKDLTKCFGIYEAADEATVRQLIESDPYWQNGIWTDYEVKEWIQAV